MVPTFIYQAVKQTPGIQVGLARESIPVRRKLLRKLSPLLPPSELSECGLSLNTWKCSNKRQDDMCETRSHNKPPKRVICFTWCTLRGIQPTSSGATKAYTKKSPWRRCRTLCCFLPQCNRLFCCNGIAPGKCEKKCIPFPFEREWGGVGEGLIYFTSKTISPPALVLLCQNSHQHGLP